MRLPLTAHMLLLRLVRRVSLPIQGKGWGWGHDDLELDFTT